MPNKFKSSIIGILIVIMTSLISIEFNDVPSYICSLFILLSLTFICSINKEFMLNDVFLWTFLTYIIGKTIGIIIIDLIFPDVTNTPFNYSISTFANGDDDSIINILVSKITFWITSHTSGMDMLFNIIISLYKGVFVALFACAVIPNKAKK